MDNVDLADTLAGMLADDGAGGGPSSSDVGDYHPSLLMRYSAHGGNDEDEDDEDNLELLLLDEDAGDHGDDVTSQAMLHASTMVTLVPHPMDGSDEMGPRHGSSSGSGSGSDDRMLDGSPSGIRLQSPSSERAGSEDAHHRIAGVVGLDGDDDLHKSSSPLLSAPGPTQELQRRRAAGARRLTWELDTNLEQVLDDMGNRAHPVRSRFYELDTTYWAQPGMPWDEVLPEFRESYARFNAAVRSGDHALATRLRLEHLSKTNPAAAAQLAWLNQTEDAAAAFLNKKTASTGPASFRAAVLVATMTPFPREQGLRLAYEPSAWPNAAKKSADGASDTVPPSAAHVPAFFTENKPRCGLSTSSAVPRRFERVVPMPRKVTLEAAAPIPAAANEGGDSAAAAAAAAADNKEDAAPAAVGVKYLLDAGGLVRAAPVCFEPLKIAFSGISATRRVVAPAPAAANNAAAAAAAPQQQSSQKPQPAPGKAAPPRPAAAAPTVGPASSAPQRPLPSRPASGPATNALPPLLALPGGSAVGPRAVPLSSSTATAPKAPEAADPAKKSKYVAPSSFWRLP